MADGLTRIDYRAHPAATADATVYAETRAGQTIAEMLGQGASQTLRVECGGVEIPRSLWHHVRPKAGQRLTVTAYPQGGNNNKLLKLVVLVVAVVYGFYTQDWNGALQIVAYGFAAVNILVPPPTPKLPGASDPFNALASLTGTQNQASPYSPIPLVIGTCVFYPPHAALPYTEISGDDQYLRMLLDCGYGDLDISDIKIGETPIDSYDDVEYEVTTTPTLFTQDFYELAVGTTFNNDADTDTRTGQTLSSEMSLDIQFPQGLYVINANGDTLTAGVWWSVQFRKVGDASWTNVAHLAAGQYTFSSAAIELADTGNTFYTHNNQRKTLRVGLRWKLPSADQYEVQVTRTGTYFDDNTYIQNEAMWTVLRSISHKLPSSTGTTKLALRIKATDQLQGVVSTINLKATQKIRTYDSTTATWTTGVATANNAWVYHWLLTACPGVARLISEARVDIDSIVAWAADCDAMGYDYNHVESSGRTLFELLQDVLSSGRATFGMPGGKYGCVRDVPQSVPMQMFTPSNSWGFSGQRAFYDPPHALRCQWTNPEADNQQDELVVYADGYTSATATRYEVMDLRMCTNPTTVWRLGSYHLAAAKARPNIYTFTTGVENLVCKRGDLVRSAHDVVDWGLFSGRVKSVTGTRVVLDGYFDPEPGKTYALRVRRSADNTQLADNTIEPLYTWDSTMIRFDMDVSWDAPGVATRVIELGGALDIQPGDLYVLGEAGTNTMPVIIQRIEPQDDLSARITVVDAAPDVPLAGTGAPPTFVSQITGKSWCSAPDPPNITIRIGKTVSNFGGISGGDYGGSVGGVGGGGGGVSGAPSGGGIYRLPIQGAPSGGPVDYGWGNYG